jgi:hypothetical protein
MNATRLRELFSNAVDELERGADVRLIERGLREAGLSHTIAKGFVSVAKQVARIFAEGQRNA